MSTLGNLFSVHSRMAQDSMMGRRQAGAGGVGRLGVGRFEYLPTAREVCYAWQHPLHQAPE